MNLSINFIIVKLFNTFFSVADFQCDICKKIYSSSSNLNYHVKLLLMWKIAGKEVNLPVSSVKKGDVDFE